VKQGQAVTEGGLIYHDGEHVQVQTNKEIEVHQHRLFLVVNAVKALGTMVITPREYFREFPPYMNYYLEDHLRAAHAWLTEFVKEWKQHRCCKASMIAGKLSVVTRSVSC